MKRQLFALMTLLLLLPAIGCAAWPTGSISTTNLDADSDSPLLARPALKTTVDQVNAIRDNGEPLLKSTYTAADILTKIKTVDGAASGLDADLVDGSHYSAADVLTKVKTVDGTGSGLDADLWKGKNFFSASAVYDAPSLSTGQNGAIDIAVTGVEMGDFCQLSSSAPTGGFFLYCTVWSAGNVRGIIYNYMASTYNLPSASYFFRVTEQ